MDLAKYKLKNNLIRTGIKFHKAMRHEKIQSPKHRLRIENLCWLMACSLIEHKRINTTVAKAKALKQFVEPLITKSKLIRLITVVFVSLIYVANML
jgi:hypothetical protein